MEPRPAAAGTRGRPLADDDPLGIAPGSSPGGGETILLVDDEDLVRQLVRRALELRGYRVLDAAGPAEAVRLARAAPVPIDLIVSDVGLPAMDGHQLVEQLRGVLPDAGVILVSGYDEHSVLGGGAALEDVAFLAKPFAPSDLHETVRAVLDARPARPIGPRAGRDRAA